MMTALDRCSAGLRRRVLLAAFALSATTWAHAQFTPNEYKVSPHRGLIDFEISQSKAKIAWTDTQGDMWLADVNRTTGLFQPLTGRGQLIATNTVSNWNMFMWNGPEWLPTATGDQIFFSYYLAGQPGTANNTRMALATQDTQSGAWTVQTLSPDLPRMSHIASKDPGDTGTPIKYLDPALNQYWRNANDPGSERLMPFIPPSNKSWRFASGVRAMLYTSVVDGIPQVFRYLLDTGISEQLTSDAGAKDTDRTVPWMWRAPEFGNDFVFSTVANGSELRIYRQFPGATDWTLVYSASVPLDSTIGSPEWFTYNGKSYVFMAVFVSPDTYPSEIWISSIDPANPLMRRINDNTLKRARNDPEVFVTDNAGPFIYYNRYDPSIDPGHPLCSDCSEGVFRANPGLFRR